MSITFSNRSRSFDPEKARVRFWGYDGIIEVSFFVDDGALRKLHPLAGTTEEEILAVFDLVRNRIHIVAERVYARSRKRVYFCSLSASDF